MDITPSPSYACPALPSRPLFHLTSLNPHVTDPRSHRPRPLHGALPGQDPALQNLPHAALIHKQESANNRQLRLSKGPLNGPPLHSRAPALPLATLCVPLGRAFAPSWHNMETGSQGIPHGWTDCV